MIEKNLFELRRNYKLKSLDVKDVKLNPFEQFSVWFDEVLDSNLIEPNALILATADNKCKPSVRALLLKEFSEKGFIFYTNYESRKGKELAGNNQASILFYWAELERQVRLEGLVEKIPEKDSYNYFSRRPFKSRVGAWASNQSEVIDSRFTIIKKFIFYLLKFHSKEIPLPPYWGGYILIPDTFEFWQGRESRLHDRIRYRKENNLWIIERLSP